MFVPHDYVCSSLNAEVRARQSDRTAAGPLSCSADVLPFDFTFNVRPHQYLQYQRLLQAIKSQQRFDTMFRQRPSVSPLVDAQAWWKYAIACVMSRPNSRTWEDIRLIVQGRRRYMELVVKKSHKHSDGNGFHGSLSDLESAELLELEDLLPMEALETFHLLALRHSYESREPMSAATASFVTVDPPSTPNSRQRGRSKGPNPFRILVSSGTRERSRRSAPYSELSHEDTGARQSLHDSSSSVDQSRPNTISLLEAMTLRLGKKVWFILWKLHDATVNLVLLGTKGASPLAHTVLRAGGTIRSFGKGKRDFFFDLSQCDVFHRQDRVMYIRLPVDESLAESDDTGSEPSSFDGGATVASTISVEESIEGGPDLITASRFLPLPPRGTVCRLSAGQDCGNCNLSISAHPATLIWTTSLFDSLSEFLNVRSSEEQEDLTQLIRNAATPLARKAQLALVSPTTMSIHLHISAPKIWVPIFSQSSAGSLLLDAGTIKVAGLKCEAETDMNWDVQSRDIRVNFVRSRILGFRSDDLTIQALSHIVETTGRSDTAIVQPVHLSLEARNRIVGVSDHFLLREGSPVVTGQVRGVDIVVSPISLNLIDAEGLARLFGKWYGRIVHRVRGRSATSSPTSSAFHHKQRPDDPSIFLPQTVPQLLTLAVSKLEVALEGHSKAISGAMDDRSLASQDSYHEVAPPKRTYVFEVQDIAIRQSRKGYLKRTMFTIWDASICRLREGSFYAPLRMRRDGLESQYAILVRTGVGLEAGQPTEILRATIMHDGQAHLDEVEIDIDSVTLRVTPTTLKDCAKAFRRVAEFAQLVTREMERKVHEEGRKARRFDKDGT